MKNQYFGDVNDYRKYGLLRALSGEAAFRIGMCWMLTPNDGRGDGKFIDYLATPQRWRKYDPPLFDLLHKYVNVDGHRSVALAEAGQLLPRAEFYSEMLSDTLADRSTYFAGVKQRLAQCDLNFFDPDNGIEVKSVGKGRRGSAKYIYWDELAATFGEGHSLLVYQHFPREKRVSYIERSLAAYRTNLGSSNISCLQTARVVYFLVLQKKHVEMFAPIVGRLAVQWANQIKAG